ncbi:hypothetical protein [Chromohalobacter canadensis]|uniref:hypothetical protein n=1 Tax=Chromohalobacter canadensis TaxID=141389 RepID=UPI00240F2F96|nr:hypothetical protein [Chromohalobacter canadensis]
MANISFDANYYYEQKLNQLQSTDSEQYGDWTIADVALAFNESGLTAEEHYEQYGATEGLNPSAEFDSQAYLSAKLGQMQEQDSEQYADWTVADVAQAFEESGLSPLEHYNQFGQDEGLEAVPAGESTGSLTEALSDLADAQQAEVDFREGLGDLDVNADGEIDVDGSVDVEAGEASADDVKDFYTNASANMKAQTNIDSFAGRSATVQDAAISDKQSELETAVQDETDDAADGMTSLLETLETRQETLATKQAEVADAEEAYSDEVTAFDAVNNVTVGTTAGNVNFVNDEFGTLTSEGDIDTAYAELVDGQWELTADGATAGDSSGKLKGIADLYAQSQALDSANATEQTALDAVQETVEDIILAESGAYEVADNGSAFDETTGAVDLSAGDATVYETEAAADAGTEAVYTIDLAGAETDNTASTGETITIGGETVFTGETGGTGITDAAAIVSDIDSNTVTIDTVTYDIAAVSDSTTQITLTAQSVADVTADLTVGGTGTAPTTTTFATTTDGEAAGATESADISDANALSNAISALEGFEEQVSSFEESRDLNNQLDSLEGDIEDATAAIENDPDNEDAPGLGVTLADFTDGAQGTSDNEVFLFEDSTDTDVDIGNFGAGGEDKIYFGEGFSLVELGDDAISDNVGDAAAQEIFWEQDGNNVNLYVEAETFGGNSAGEADVTKVTLTGVDGADINDELSAGFLSAGEVA